MAPRRSHKKSRNGCSQCKNRRVKCAENRPICQNCSKRGISCSFETESLTPDTVGGHGSPYGPSGDGILTRAEEMELMHYYSVHTYETIETEAKMKRWQQRMLPPIALQNDFLLDAVFSFTCLHLAALRPEKALKYCDAGMQYRNRALSRLQVTLVDPSPEQCFAMFHTSVFVGLFSFALPQVNPEAKDASVVQMFTELANLWRGSGTIMNLSKEVLGEAQFHADFEVTPKTRDVAANEGTEADHALKRLERMANDLPPDRNKEPYLQALHALTIGYEAHAVDGAHNDILAFTTKCGKDFYPLVIAHDPLARLIMACYAVLLDRIDAYWWARGIGQRLAKELSQTIVPLDADGQAIWAWAMQRVRLVG